MSIQIIYFVHGTTYDNEMGKCSGWKQAELTDIGKERAIKLGEIRKDTYFDIIFTSPLKRARETAEIIILNFCAQVEKIL